MAVEVPEARVIYFVISKTEFNNYAESYVHRFLRRSETKPTIDETTEDLIKVAVTVFPSTNPEINTDPFALTDWNGGLGYNKAWADGVGPEVNDWIFYDESVAKPYNDNGILDDETNVIINGFIKKDLTYYYYDSSNAYAGSGSFTGRGENNSATMIAPRSSDGSIADDKGYDITWTGTGWDVVKKEGGESGDEADLGKREDGTYDPNLVPPGTHTTDPIPIPYPKLYYYFSETPTVLSPQQATCYGTTAKGLLSTSIEPGFTYLVGSPPSFNGTTWNS
jgi:hypothetical protein